MAFKLNRTMNKWTKITLGLAATGLVACGPPDGEKETAGIDHATAQQALRENTSIAAQRLSAAMQFLETAPVVETGFHYGGTTTVCEPLPAGAPDGAEPTCYEESGSADIDFDFNDESAQLSTEIENRILTDANIEAETATSITYRLKGSVVCAQDDAPADPDCVKSIDDGEIRLVVTSPSDGDIDVDVLIGPDRANPLSLELHSDLLAAEIDLGGIEASVEHLETITGDAVDLPATFEGRVRAELLLLGPQNVEVSLSVLQAVKVADGEYALSMAPAVPMTRLAVDGAAKTLTSEVNAGAIDGKFPVSTWTYDETTMTETETRYDVGFHLGGLTGLTTIGESLDTLVMTGLGLGPDTSTVSINGQQVMGVDLNADSGRTLDATFRATNDGFELEVAPELDLAVLLQFASAADVFGDIDDWMLDDVLRVSLDGAAAPKLSVSDGTMKVVEGELTVALDKAGISHTATAGQCMLQSENAVDSTDPDAVWTPLHDVAAGTCE